MSTQGCGFRDSRDSDLGIPRDSDLGIPGYSDLGIPGDSDLWIPGDSDFGIPGFQDRHFRNVGPFLKCRDDISEMDRHFGKNV